MAKNHSKNEGKASLIFIWILVILLAVGTVFVVKNYKDTHSDIIKNDEIAAALSTAFDKPIGQITAEDLATIEGVALTLDNFVFVDNSIQYVDQIAFMLKGYTAEYDKLSNDEDGLSTADQEALAPYVATATLSEKDIADQLSVFTGITTLQLQNYGAESVKFDMNTIPADTFKNLESLSVYGYEVSNFDSIAGHTGITDLYLSNTKVADVSAVKNLTKLEYINLGGAEITDVSAIEELTSLKELYIIGTSIEKVPALDKLTVLETLYVTGETVTDVTAVENAVTVKNLTLSGTSITALPSIEKLTALETVDFSSNNLIDISALSVLNNDKITSVKLTGNAIEDFAPIAHIDEAKITKDEPEAEITDEIEVVDETEATDETEIVEETEGTDKADVAEAANDTEESDIAENTDTAEAGEANETPEATE